MNKVEDHLLAVFNALSKDKDKWKYVTDEQKDKYSFIINRNLSKIYPEKAQLLNIKGINKGNILDIWYYYLYNIPSHYYVKKFWNKEKIEKENSISKKDFELLIKHYQIRESDLKFLIKNFNEEITDELKYLNSISKNK